MTVKQLKAELDRFEDDAPCMAYEGEVIGIVVGIGDGRREQGVIHCSGDYDGRETDLGDYGKAQAATPDPMNSGADPKPG